MTRIRDTLPGPLADLLPVGVSTRRANWIEVARMDCAHGIRSWALWTLCGIFISLLILIQVETLIFFIYRDVTPPAFVAFGSMSLVTRWFVPLAALLSGALAVSGERDAGSLRVLLGLPITRRDVLLGKLLGRSIAFCSMILVGLTFTGAVVWYIYGDFNPGSYALFVSLTLLYGLVFVWIGIGFSTLFRSRARSTGVSAGAFALIGFVWHVLPVSAFYLVDGQFPDNVPEPWNPPAWFVFFGNANPFNGYYALIADWIHGANPGILRTGTMVYRGYAIEGPSPFYLQPEFLLVVMLLWALVPLVVGSWRFTRSDLA